MNESHIGKFFFIAIPTISMPIDDEPDDNNRGIPTIQSNRN